MTTIARLTLAAALAFALAGGALAQAQAPASADPAHGAHNPATPQAAPPAGRAPQGMGAPGGMMDGDMARMMQMMQERRTAAAMQPFRRVEGQLAFFRAELRISDAQAPQWNAFADAVRAGAEQLRAATAAAMAGGTEAAAAPQQMERRVALLAAQLETMRAVSAAAGPLYAALSEEQRRTADELLAEHFRMMRMGMP